MQSYGEWDQNIHNKIPTSLESMKLVIKLYKQEKGNLIPWKWKRRQWLWDVEALSSWAIQSMCELVVWKSRLWQWFWGKNLGTILILTDSQKSSQLKCANPALGKEQRFI